MLRKIQFISLRLTRYNDRQNVLTAYSRQAGRISLLVPAASGKGNNRVRALIMPLNQVECEVNFKPHAELYNLRSPLLVDPMPDIHLSPSKQMTAMFLAETLAIILGESQGNEGLYDFLVSSIKVLNDTPADRTLNFHIAFLARLTRHLGIEPDLESYKPKGVLDMREGRWLDSPPAHADFLQGIEAEAARRVMQLTYENMSAFRYSASERARLLDCILTYYSIHYVPLKSLKSLGVLRELALR